MIHGDLPAALMPQILGDHEEMAPGCRGPVVADRRRRADDPYPPRITCRACGWVMIPEPPPIPAALVPDPAPAPAIAVPAADIPPALRELALQPKRRGGRGVRRRYRPSHRVH